jgi:ABC-2 type transport system permease protein
VTRLVDAELFKLRTTRTFLGLTLGAVVLVVLICALAAALGHFTHGDRPGLDLLNVAGLAQPFALVLGILSVSSDFRHGTITPSLLAVPDRLRLLAAKLCASVLVGLALGLVCTGIAVALVLGIISARGIASGVDSSRVVRIVVGNTLATGLYAGLGAGFGALVRNQVGAVVGALGWLFILEPLSGIVHSVGVQVQKYGIGGVGNALSDTAGNGDHVLAQVPGGLLLLAYAAVFTVAGAWALRRRDVSA